MFSSRLVLKKVSCCLLFSAFLLGSCCAESKDSSQSDIVTKKSFLVALAVGGFGITIGGLSSLDEVWGMPGCIIGALAMMTALHGLFSYVDESEHDDHPSAQFYYDSSLQDPYSWDCDSDMGEHDAGQIGRASSENRDEEENKKTGPCL